MSNTQKAYSVLMAAVTKQIYPDLLIDNIQVDGNKSWNDFNNSRQLSQEDLKKITIGMKKAISQDIPFRFEMVEKEKIRELIQQGKLSPNVDLSGYSEKVPLLSVKDFSIISEDLGIRSTKDLSADSFKLNSLSAIALGGSSSNNGQRLTIISATNKEEFTQELARIEDALKRDHRKIGQDMELFFISQNGPGLAMFEPNGAIIRRTIESFEHFEHAKRGYKPVYTPHVYNATVWKKSGHYDCYKDNMFLFEEAGEEMGVKPMNCPGHVEIFNRHPRSYRDLPMKFFELGTVYRREDRGALQGLLRVTNITQDDAHIFCRKDQLKEEIVKVVDFIEFMMKTFGLETEYEISTRPEKSIGEEKTWEFAEKTLRDALTSTKIKKFGIDAGGGAFYGPKIDVKMKDALGRQWQGPTIQLDFNFPERFNMEYTNADGSKERPVMLHRTVLGSMERFLGVLIEHYNGKFPLWLAPEQCAVLTVNDTDQKVLAYRDQVVSNLFEEGFRPETAIRGNSLGARIAHARNHRIPYIVILGQKEAENSTVSIRVRDDNSQHYNIPLDRFIDLLKSEQKSRALKSVFTQLGEQRLQRSGINIPIAGNERQRED